MRLGDTVELALTKVGVTKNRVERWLGRPCGCLERKEKLNELHGWAKKVLTGKCQDAEEHLNDLITAV